MHSVDIREALLRAVGEFSGVLASRYEEMAGRMSRLRQELAVLASNYKGNGWDFTAVAPVPTELTLESIYATATASQAQWEQAAGHGTVDADQVANRKQRLLASLTLADQIRTTLSRHVEAACAGAIVWGGTLPPKFNTVIQPLMASIKVETEAVLVSQAAEALARLVRLCLGKTPSPNDKLIGNACKALCAQQLEAESADPEAPSRCGGAYVVRALAREWHADLFEALPRLWLATGGAVQAVGKEDPTITQPSSVKAVVEAAMVLRVLAPALDPSLRPRIAQLLPQLFLFLRQQEVRRVVARCVARIGCVATVLAMEAAIEETRGLLALLKAPDDAALRAGAAEAVLALIEELGIDVLPYAVFLVVPLMARMSDQEATVRAQCTRAFALIVKILPLESGIPAPTGFNSALVAKKDQERRFLQQLLDSSQADNYEIPVPLSSGATLRSYQQAGVNWLAFLYRSNLHGILCDDMGLGKTLQTICIIAAAVCDWRKELARRRGDGTLAALGQAHLPSLVVCPPTLVLHWVNEFTKFIPGHCSVVAYTGAAHERRGRVAQLMEHDVVVTSYENLRSDIEQLTGWNWNFCVLDEGHAIRNSKSKLSQAVKRVKARHRLVLSGTPIQNNVLELWSLFDYLMPGYLGTEKQFNQLYGRPIKQTRSPKCTVAEHEAGEAALQALHRQVLPFVLRRMKEEVLHDLPPKIIQDYYCDLSPLQQRLYENFAKSQLKRLIQGDLGEAVPATGEKRKRGGDGAGNHTFQALHYLRKLCNHPLLVLSPEHPEYSRVMGDLEAQHSTIRDLQHAPKVGALKALLQECGIGMGPEKEHKEEQALTAGAGHRVLIFCQMKVMLDVIEQDLFKQHMPTVSYLRMDGSVPAGQRQGIVDKFNGDPTIDVLLLSTHVGGLGLNLTGADTVIFVEHDWNPMKDRQAMDRAHRIGQKRTVNVYRLITRGTLEEKIMGLQKFKLHLANSVFTEENSSLHSMDTSQLLDLMNYSGATAATTNSALPDPSSEAAAAGLDGSVPEGGKVTMSKVGSGLKSVLASLGELWGEEEYQEEYDMDHFLANLRAT